MTTTSREFKHNHPGYKFYVVNMQTIAIDSGWKHREEALDRAVALKNEGGAPKVMTKPRVGAQNLDPNDDASWIAKRNNPGRQERRYHIVAINEKTGKKEYCTDSPLTHSEAVMMKSKFTPHRNVRIQLEDAGRNPSSNPPPSRTARKKFFGSEYEAREYLESIDDPEQFQIRWRHVQDDFVVEPKDSAQQNARENPRFGNPRRARKNPNAVVVGSLWRNRVEHERDPKGLRHIYRITSIDKMVSYEDPVTGADGSSPLSLWEESFVEVKENPGELLIVNDGATEHDSARAEKIFQMWHQKNPNNVAVLDTGCDGSDEMVCVGNAHDIVYVSGKWEKGRKTNAYVHTFDSQPKVWMLAHLVESLARENPGTAKSVDSLLKCARNKDGRFAVAELARPESFSLTSKDGDGDEISIHAGAKLYGAVDKKTVIIVDPQWGLIVIKGGEMYFDERGIVK